MPNEYDHLASENSEFFKPDHPIKRKAGSGGIPEVLLQRGQETIDDNYSNDFEPFAKEFLKNIAQALDSCRAARNRDAHKLALQQISRNIMELKANGGMFGYSLISMISDVPLNFADTQRTVNEDFCQIIEAHNNSLILIITHRLKGAGGEKGKELVRELQDAIARYHRKYGQ
jgi:hypothetical protein